MSGLVALCHFSWGSYFTIGLELRDKKKLLSIRHCYSRDIGFFIRFKVIVIVLIKAIGKVIIKAKLKVIFREKK